MVYWIRFDNDGAISLVYRCCMETDNGMSERSLNREQNFRSQNFTYLKVTVYLQIDNFLQILIFWFK